MITAIHRWLINGAAPCGQVAFFYDDDGAPEDRIEAARVRMTDGSKPVAGSVMVCGACGAQIGPAALDLLPGEWDVRAT
jgi:hypothetical protein